MSGIASNGFREVTDLTSGSPDGDARITNDRIAAILQRLAVQRDATLCEHLNACLDQVARDHRAALMELEVLLSQQARAALLGMIEASLKHAFPLLDGGIGLAIPAGAARDDPKSDRPDNREESPFEGKALATVQSEPVASVPSLADPPSDVAPVAPAVTENAISPASDIAPDVASLAPTPASTTVVEDPRADAGASSDSRELFEGTVHLKVETDGCVRQMVHFMDGLRQKPQLRLLQMVGERQQAVGVWLGLREPLPLKEVLLRMDGVSDVGVLAAIPGSSERELTVRLEEDPTQEEAQLASGAKA